MEISELHQKYLESGKVSTDSRQITSGSVFFALKGPNFDANKFALEALAKGASYVVVDDPVVVSSNRCLLVKDCLIALQDLARYHRSKMKIPFIGLTGSNGKTTSKELVYAVLSKKFKTVATVGNLNNHIGVPLTVLSVNHKHEMAIVEMGANHVGEIATLCSISNPTHGFITNIGKAHVGAFGGFENIVRAKSELYQYLLTNNGTVFINSGDAILGNMAKRFKEPLFYPAQGDYYHCRRVDDDHVLTVDAENGERVKTKLIGAYNFENVAVALTLGKYFGVDAKLANSAVAEYQPGNMRSQMIHKGTNTIILDAYNANPSSMEAAIDNLARMKEKRKVAILGDMYELEEAAEEEHRQVGTLLQKKGIKEAYLCGPLMKSASNTFKAGKHFDSLEALKVELKLNPLVGATILVKGSRGMKMESVMEVL